MARAARLVEHVARKALCLHFGAAHSRTVPCAGARRRGRLSPRPAQPRPHGTGGLAIQIDRSRGRAGPAGSGARLGSLRSRAGNRGVSVARRLTCCRAFPTRVALLRQIRCRASRCTLQARPVPAARPRATRRLRRCRRRRRRRRHSRRRRRRRPCGQRLQRLIPRPEARRAAGAAPARSSQQISSCWPPPFGTCHRRRSTQPWSLRPLTATRRLPPRCGWPPRR